MECPQPLPLAWLDPTLEACRSIVEKGVHHTDLKPGPNGRALVTDVDLQIERALTLAIRSRVPGASIVSEEAPFSPQVLDEAGTCFVLDPIDGTDELVAGRSGFSISVAEYRRGSPVAAVVDFPRMTTRIGGGVGTGACVDGRRVQLDETAHLTGSRIAVSASQHRDGRLRSVWASIDAVLVPVPAFTPKFAAVLRGDCVAAVHLPVDDRRTHVWDYAAVATLLFAAGGAFVTWTGQDLLRGRPLVHIGGWIAAATPGLVGEIREAAQPAIDRLPGRS